MPKDIISGDRRLQRRYPLELDLEYKTITDNRVISSGTGRTRDISSGGVLFQAAASMNHGTSVELSVRWPAILGNTPFLELNISGRLVRSDSHSIAMRMSRYHFQKLPEVRSVFEDLFTDAVIQ